MTIPNVLVNADLAQAEARIVAWESDDPGLKALFNSGIDYHTANAMNIFNLKSMDDVTSAQRQSAKIGGHGTNYDMSAPTLALQLGVSLAFAKDFQAKYKSAYPYIGMWHSRILDSLKKTRCVYNLFGRKYQNLGRLDDNAYRNALAFTPQSTIADLIDHAIVSLWEERPTVHLLIQGHDSLLFSVPYPEVDTFIPWLRSHMEIPLTSSQGERFIIPADFEVGWNWKELIRYLTPAEESMTKACLAAGMAKSDVVSLHRLHKDAVAAVAAGQTWRRHG